VALFAPELRWRADTSGCYRCAPLVRITGTVRIEELFGGIFQLTSCIGK